MIKKAPKISYKCSNCNKSYAKYVGQCTSCKKWNTIEEETISAKVYRVPKISEKRKAVTMSNGKFNSDLELDKWFEDRRKEMKGACMCGCNNKTSKDDNEFYRASIAHILPKRHFKSVSTHPLNWIELSHWGGCHGNMDNKSSFEWEKMACWGEIKRRFFIMYPLIKQEEYKHLPKVFISLLEGNTTQ